MSDEIPLKEKLKQRRVLRDNTIRALYRSGFSMDEICVKEGVSKTTVFFALKGRSKKRGGEIPKLTK